MVIIIGNLKVWSSANCKILGGAVSNVLQEIKLFTNRN